MTRYSYIYPIVLMLTLGVAPAHAQTLNLASGTAEDPVAIDAQGGIEWNQKDKVFIAAGPAKATRGDLVLDADEMRAYYREGGAGGRSEIFRLDAIGHVRITQPGRVATGGHATYDVDKAVVVLKDGDPVKLVAGSDIITAQGQLEFWDARKLAVARGDAEAVRPGKRIRADVLTAYFGPDANGKTRVDRVEAFDNVRIDTDQEQVYANRAAYNVPSGLARLTGSVKIKRGTNEINGCSADIDLNSGISRLNSCEGAGGSVSGTTGGPLQKNKPPRVHGVLTPKGKP